MATVVAKKSGQRQLERRRCSQEVVVAAALEFGREGRERIASKHKRRSGMSC